MPASMQACWSSASRTLGVDIRQAGPVVIGQLILQLWWSTEDVQAADDGVCELECREVVGRDIIDDAVQQGPDDS